MSTINWGIIGCGEVTEVKSGPAFYKSNNSKLIAVMRRNAAKAADFAQRHNVAKWFDDGEKLINDPEVDAVYIATPPDSHTAYTLSALKKGLNVYIEKPVTLNAAEAREIADAVKQTGKKVSVAHYRRAMPMFIYIKDAIDKGVIGDVRTVMIRLWQSVKPELVTHVEDNWRVDPARSGGGYFHDMAPHQLDLMLYFFGEPEFYHGVAINQSGANPCEDHITGFIKFKNNVVFNGSWSFNVTPDRAIDFCEIIGSKGSINFPVFGNTVNVKTEFGSEDKTFDPGAHIAQPMVQQVVDYFNGDQAQNPCSIEDAIPLMDIMDAFAESK